MKKDMLGMIALLLVIVGGLNWGLVGLLNMNLVSMIFGFMPMLEQLVYVLVGLSALFVAYSEFLKA